MSTQIPVDPPPARSLVVLDVPGIADFGTLREGGGGHWAGRFALWDLGTLILTAISHIT